MKHELLQPLRGIIPPLVTPLIQDGQVDVPALERLVEHLVAGGVHGLFVLGTTGEGPSLAMDVRRDLIRRVCALVDRRIPVLVGVTDASLAESVALANFAAEQGCAAAVAAPPFYFSISQRELLTHFLEMNAKLALPLVLYNMPAVTGLAIEPETVRQLILEESIVGLKDSSGDLDYFQELLKVVQVRPDFPLMVGPEHLIGASMALGGQGGVAGGANIWPQPFVELYHAAVESDQDMVAHWSEKIAQLGAIYSVGPFSIPGIIARTKAALSVCQLCSDTTAPPIARVSEDERQQIKAILEPLGLVPNPPQNTPNSVCA